MPPVGHLKTNPSLNEICEYKEKTLDAKNLLMDGITNRFIDCPVDII